MKTTRLNYSNLFKPLLIIAIAGLVIISCKKNEDDNIDENPPVVNPLDNCNCYKTTYSYNPPSFNETEIECEKKHEKIMGDGVYEVDSLLAWDLMKFDAYGMISWIEKVDCD